MDVNDIKDAQSCEWLMETSTLEIRSLVVYIPATPKFALLFRTSETTASPELEFQHKYSLTRSKIALKTLNACNLSLL